MAVDLGGNQLVHTSIRRQCNLLREQISVPWMTENIGENVPFQAECIHTYYSDENYVGKVVSRRRNTISIQTSDNHVWIQHLVSITWNS